MPEHPPHKPRRSKGPPPGGSHLTVRRLSAGGWVFVPPRCARDRSEDLEEVRLMIDAGELEVAVDELRWLLSGCSEMIAAHVLLGELAIEMGPDKPLARGHFGFAYQLSIKALNRAAAADNLSPQQPANRPFYEAARGLAWCLEQLGKPDMASEVAANVRRFDPSDAFGVAELLDELRSGGKPMVDLGG